MERDLQRVRLSELSVLRGLDRLHDPCSRVGYQRALDAIPNRSHRTEQGFRLNCRVELEIDQDVVRCVRRPKDRISAHARPWRLTRSKSIGCYPVSHADMGCAYV